MDLGSLDNTLQRHIMLDTELLDKFVSVKIILLIFLKYLSVLYKSNKNSDS